MKTRLFTAGIVEREGKVLILRRKLDDDTYPGLWDCVGGHFEQGESAEGCMKREATEESGLKVEITKVGRLSEYRDRYGRSVFVSFLLKPKSHRLNLSEHAEARWVSPVEAKTSKSVPALKIALDEFGV
jgi:8-oxo-dGTP diphosphatase